MEALMLWIMESQYGAYFVGFWTILGALVSIASVIVPFTKTPKDDEILAKVKEFVARFSLFEMKK